MALAKMPIWLRSLIVAGAVVLVVGAGTFGYRWYSRPMTLTIGVGSLDGEATRLVSALASRLAVVNAPVRLKLVETTNAVDAAEQFAAEKVDLAVVRGDVGDLSQAQAIVVLAHAVVLLVAPPGSAITDIAGLKRVSVGVIGGEINRNIVNVLSDEYGLGRANVTFRNLQPTDARRALDAKEVRAILIVVPLAEKYLALLRGLFLQTPKTAPVLLPIEAAGAIAEKQRAYESFDVPKGTLRGSPPIPGEDLTTLRVSFYVVARKELSAEMAGSLADALMKARRDLLGELPILSQMTAPSTDTDAFLPVHPGAAAFYNGTRQSFLDEWGNIIFLVPMIFGGLISVLAAAWKFLRVADLSKDERGVDSLYALGARIRTTEVDSELSDIEAEIDRVLQMQRAKTAAGDENALDVTTLNVAAHRLQSLIHDRRILLSSRPGSSARAARSDLDRPPLPAVE
ncbi:C4-dicarboxylate ABC transporter substrate-binding protein [Bradyrhizobium sp. CSA207]|uniref:TAXI family TRAP transporter solute-binding subunit n=1 Tax=Bradyrhizobium sp. CSA207 TaxID=2698826 RepID=UPI0023AE85C5|nr:TAXI family TRAP transporter solute-binding subunit [Bradyrhizobium sp. CSA207]MDE5444254.1 C4-dicarboxylate ABC transporter substrate-binding protein [Bradyrhizobium sp. CSA207]